MNVEDNLQFMFGELSIKAENCNTFFCALTFIRSALSRLYRVSLWMMRFQSIHLNRQYLNNCALMTKDKHAVNYKRAAS